MRPATWSPRSEACFTFYVYALQNDTEYAPDAVLTLFLNKKCLALPRDVVYTCRIWSPLANKEPVYG
jgi:hypothetical protein